MNRENRAEVLARIKEIAPWLDEFNVTDHETLLQVAYIIGHSDGMNEARDVMLDHFAREHAH